jgi:hypothetical protein
MRDLARILTGAAIATLLAGCHPEQYRWSQTPSFVESAALESLKGAGEDRPTVAVYSYATPSAVTKSPAAGASSQSKPVGVQSLSDRGQEAFIDRIASVAKDPNATLQAIVGKADNAASGGEGIKLVEENQFDRTLVVSVSKPISAKPGDRLMKTIVEVTPSVQGAFEFAGYTIPATDTKLQSIAHVDNKTVASLSGTLSPTLKGAVKGAGEATASIADTTEGTADIGEQYENLNVDITPRKLRIIRESERGLDLAGNTIINPITIALPTDTLIYTAFLVPSSSTFFKDGKPIKPDLISFTPSIIQFPATSDLKVDVKLIYQLRQPDDNSRKYYVEGSQKVSITSDVVVANGQTLIRGSELTPTRFHLLDNRNQGSLYMKVEGIQLEVIFNDYYAAHQFASWMNLVHPKSLGKDGFALTVQNKGFGADGFTAVAR